MRASVASAFIPFNTGRPPFKDNLEGDSIPYMYLDVGDVTDPSVPGKVTTWIGNLIDPVALALDVAWYNDADGSQATPAQVTAAWQTVKGRQDLKSKGGGAFKGLTSVHLTQASGDALVAKHLANDEDFLRGQFPGFEDWPADAQLALLSLSWARGAAAYAKSFPKLYAALNKTTSDGRPSPDFATAAVESHMYNGAPKRNAANYQMFMNAATVANQGLDPETLWYPGEPSGSSSSGGSGSAGAAGSGSAASAAGVDPSSLAQGWDAFTKYLESFPSAASTDSERGFADVVNSPEPSWPWGVKLAMGAFGVALLAKVLRV